MSFHTLLDKILDSDSIRECLQGDGDSPRPKSCASPSLPGSSGGPSPSLGPGRSAGPSPGLDDTRPRVGSSGARTRDILGVQIFTVAKVSCFPKVFQSCSEKVV